ncbi:MAG TPA: hypothetical protein VEA78_08285 [Acidimicrobiales bacterium]|nr:hypothetical protein [Acidimicrobiales bacterium]
MSMDVRPTPSDEEMAAIAAAVSQTVLRPVVVVAGGAEAGSRPPAWRFSGRWWRRPVVTRRDRPVW